MNSNICLWCGKDTTGDKTKEHIFPECIGGKKTLPIGYVCTNCNNFFSHNVDRALLKEHSGMMDAYQVDPGIKRKGKGREKKERYKKEKISIQGIGEASSTRISREGNTINFLDANFEVKSVNFLRSLHKCVANILCDSYGPHYVRKNYPKLLDFVLNGGDAHPWSYALSFPIPINRPLISEPQIIISLKIEKNNKTFEINSFIHTSGIWVVGSAPYILCPEMIYKFSDLIEQKLKKIMVPNSNKTIIDFFGFDWNHNKREHIGKLKFLWIVKEIEGSPNDDFFYLLTKCKICGQTTPTGIILPRDIIYKGNVNKSMYNSKNTWNQYTIDDLKKLGYDIEKWDKNSLNEFMNQGIRIPIENDVKKLMIKNCETNCINCNNMIKFNAEDCFI